MPRMKTTPLRVKNLKNSKEIQSEVIKKVVTVTEEPIRNYYYDAEGAVVKIYIPLDGLLENPPAIEAYFKPLSLNFVVKDFQGKNLNLKIPNLAHETISDLSSLKLRKDKVIIEMPKRDEEFAWISLTETDLTKVAETDSKVVKIFKNLDVTKQKLKKLLCTSRSRQQFLLNENFDPKSLPSEIFFEELRSLLQAIRDDNLSSSFLKDVINCCEKKFAAFKCDHQIIDTLLLSHDLLYNFTRMSLNAVTEVKKLIHKNVSEELSPKNRQKKTVQGPTAKTTFDSFREEAEKHLLKDNFKLAIENYMKAKKVMSDQTLDVDIAHCYILNDEKEKATEISQRLLKADSKDINGLLIKALDAYYRNLRDKALELLEACFSVNEDHEMSNRFYQEIRDVYFFNERGNALFKQKKYLEAIKLYSRGLQVKSKNRKVKYIFYLNIGVTYTKLTNKEEEALKTFNEAIALNPKYISALVRRAKVLIRMKKFESALKDLKIIKELDPKYESSMPLKDTIQQIEEDLENELELINQNGKKLYQEQQFKSSSEEFSKAIKLSPQKGNAYYSRSAAFMMMGKYVNALEDAKTYVQLEPSLVKGYLRKAKIEMMLGKFMDSTKSFRSAIKLDSDNDVAEAGLLKIERIKRLVVKGKLAVNKQEYKEALLCYTKVGDVAKESVDLQLEKIKLMLINDQFCDVEQIFFSTNKDSLIYKGAKLLYAYYSFDIDNYVTLEKDYQLVNFFPSLVDPIHVYINASALFKNSNFKDCIDILREHESIDPSNKVLLFDFQLKLGIMYSKLKKNEMAMNCSNKSIWIVETMKSEHPRKSNIVRFAYALRIACLYELKRYEEALTDAEKLYSLFPCRRSFHLKVMAKKNIEMKKRFGPDGYYGILGVNSTATMNEIRTSFQRLSLKYHPDKCYSTNAKIEGKKKFIKIHEAYKILSDPLKRESYNRGEEVNENEDQFFRDVFSPSFMFQDNFWF